MGNCESNGTHMKAFLSVHNGESCGCGFLNMWDFSSKWTTWESDWRSLYRLNGWNGLRIEL